MRDRLAVEVVTALRKGQRLREPKLCALQRMANALSGGNEQPPDELVRALYEVGYNQEPLLKLVLLHATKTVSNVAHRLTRVRLDSALKQHQWRRAPLEAESQANRLAEVD